MANPLKPLVYACSGCSNVAQLANDVAVTLDRDGVAEMSCIAGVGGHVRPLVKLAKSGRTIIALDGCPLNCVKACLAQHNVTADHHFELTSLMGIRKQPGESCSMADNYRTLKRIYQQLCPINVRFIDEPSVAERSDTHAQRSAQIIELYPNVSRSG